MKIKINWMKMYCTLVGLLRDIKRHDVAETSHVIGEKGNVQVILSVRDIEKQNKRRMRLHSEHNAVEMTEVSRGTLDNNL